MELLFEGFKPSLSLAEIEGGRIGFAVGDLDFEDDCIVVAEVTGGLLDFLEIGALFRISFGRPSGSLVQILQLEEDLKNFGQ